MNSAERLIKDKNHEALYQKYLCANNKRWKGHWAEALISLCETDDEIKAKYQISLTDGIISIVVNEISILVKKKTGKKGSKYDEVVSYYNNLDFDLLENLSRRKLCYIIKFLDDDGNLVCGKVGTTDRQLMKRIQEELRDYKEIGATKCIVQRVYDCGDIPPEGLESFIRAIYIKKHPKNYKVNDRFMCVEFDLMEVDKLAKEYLG